MPSDAELAFWRIRRVLGVPDYSENEAVDAAIREELELYPSSQWSLERVRRRVGMRSRR